MARRPLFAQLPLNQSFNLTTDNAGIVTASVGPAMGSGTLIPNKIVFVDAANVTTTEDGSFYDPYNDLQEAIDRVVAEGWNSAIIMVAPGTYAGTYTIPASATALANLVISGWANFYCSFLGPVDLPSIGGQITVDAVCQVSFSNVYISAQLTTTGGSLGVDFSSCVVVSAMVAPILSVGFIGCTMSGQTISGTTALIATFDGFSWASASSMGTNFLQAGDPTAYSRQFRDTGVSEFSGTVSANVLAIGAIADITCAAPGARAGDFAIITADAAQAADYTLTFAYCATDEAHFFLRNNSRASQTFSIACHWAVLHGFMSP